MSGPFFTVPAGARSARCNSCGQQIYWIRTEGGRPMPVNTDVEGGRAPSLDRRGPDAEPGLGLSHFADCPQADQWRRGR